MIWRSAQHMASCFWPAQVRLHVRLQGQLFLHLQRLFCTSFLNWCCSRQSACSMPCKPSFQLVSILYSPVDIVSLLEDFKSAATLFILAMRISQWSNFPQPLVWEVCLGASCVHKADLWASDPRCCASGISVLWMSAGWNYYTYMAAIE